MTLKNGFGKCSLFASSANGWTDQNMDSSFSRKKIHNMEKALFDWPIVLQHDVKVNYRLILRNPLDKPIKSLDFRSFVVSVLFARFHFKVKRKLLYLTFYHVSLKSDQIQFSPRKRNGYKI